MDFYQPLKSSTKPKGSILIWSVLLGFTLTSVFFFFGVRQRMNITIQRGTAEILNEKFYLNSLADYFESRIKTEKKPIKIQFKGIQIHATKSMDFIDGYTDFNQGATYGFSGNIFINWNQCDGKNPTERGDLKIGNQIYFAKKHGENCKKGKAYHQSIGPIAVTAPFTIETLNSPFHFQINEKDGKPLAGNKWQLELKKTLSNKKTIQVYREFN